MKNSGTSTSRFQKEIEKLHQLQIESERKNKQLKDLDISNVAEPSHSPLDDEKVMVIPTSEEESVVLLQTTELSPAAENGYNDPTNASIATPSSQSTHDGEGATEAESTMSMKDTNLLSSDNIIAGDKSADTSTDTTTTQRQIRVRHSSSPPNIDFVPPLIVALFIVIVGIMFRKIVSIIEEIGVLDEDAA